MGRLAEAVRMLRAGSTKPHDRNHHEHSNLQDAVHDWKARRAHPDVVGPCASKPANDVAALAYTHTAVTYLDVAGPCH
ncbi:hypothetical protein L840_2868 [Mycobacterium sp. MAC_011194_8550]|nr:hypothetical protein L840_2868 [Mycobacterium sp. MAC_011194_8550]